MSIKEPYYRIFRPNKYGSKYDAPYTIDNRNILNWSSSIIAFDLIVNDFKTICQYIDPCEENLGVHSHRLYELFVRICTEIESSMKTILEVNGYQRKAKKDNNINKEKLSMVDYKRLEPVLKLSDYKVFINFWNSGRGQECIPFRNLARGKTNRLVWYEDYNKVKHNRVEEFHLANLDNVIDSLCGLFVILFSQYGPQIFSPYQEVTEYRISHGNVICGGDTSVFSIELPEWNDNEQYDFDWGTISRLKSPFHKFFI